MRKIAITISKGGTSKSTTSVSIAHGLARANKKILCIDTDDQSHVSILLGIKPKKGLADVLNKSATVDESLTQARPNLWVLSGGKDLVDVKMAIAHKQIRPEMTLTEALKPIEGKFDYVIIDTSPACDMLMINTLFYADEVLTPVSMEALTLAGLNDFMQTMSYVQQYHPLKHSYILPTFVDRRNKKSHEILAQLNEYFPSQLCGQISFSTKLSEAAGFGQTIFEFDPKGIGARDYTSVIERIIEDER